MLDLFVNITEKFFYLFGKTLYITHIINKKLINKYLSIKYHKKAKKIGKCVRFNGVSFISGWENIIIGNNVHIGDNAFIRGEGGLYIGDNTHISRNLVLYTINHNYEGNLLPYDSTFRKRKVIIEKNVWIGMNVVILPGTHIEEGSIIGAGAVVVGKIPKCSIYVASAGKVLKYRDIEHYENLERNRKYGGINGEELSKNCY